MYKTERGKKERKREREIGKNKRNKSPLLLEVGPPKRGGAERNGATSERVTVLVRNTSSVPHDDQYADNHVLKEERACYRSGLIQFFCLSFEVASFTAPSVLTEPISFSASVDVAEAPFYVSRQEGAQSVFHRER